MRLRRRDDEDRKQTAPPCTVCGRHGHQSTGEGLCPFVETDDMRLVERLDEVASEIDNARDLRRELSVAVREEAPADARPEGRSRVVLRQLSDQRKWERENLDEFAWSETASGSVLDALDKLLGGA